jgi:hypothetical protein
MSLTNEKPIAGDEVKAVRVSQLGKFFEGASHTYIYKQLIPRLDTFHIGRAHWAKVESIHRLIAQLIAEGKPVTPRRGRPRKSVQLDTQPGAAA